MKRALVLSGGGARGAYEVGVWKALDELGIKCDIVTGVSVGSINGAMYAQGSLNKAIRLWKHINFKTVFKMNDVPKNNRELAKKYIKSFKDGGLEPDNLRRKLSVSINLKKLYKSPVEFGLMTVRFPKIKMIELTKNEIEPDDLVDYIIASSTMFPFFKIKQIDGTKYVDGGYRNPIPIKLAKKMGADEFIVVNISVFKKNYHPKENNITLITPNNNIGTAIKFDGSIAKKNINYGYNDTMKVYKKLFGKKYTFRNLDKHYIYDKKFKTIDKYIDSMEVLASTFGLDDSKIYSYRVFNKMIFDKIKKYKISNKTKIKDFVERDDRIVFLYNKLIAGKKINNRSMNRVLRKQYLAAYYLYINSNLN